MDRLRRRPQPVNLQCRARYVADFRWGSGYELPFRFKHGRSGNHGLTVRSGHISDQERLDAGRSSSHLIEEVGFASDSAVERTGFEPLVPPFGTDALCLPPHARMFPRVADRLRVSSQRPACRGKPDSDLVVSYDRRCQLNVLAQLLAQVETDFATAGPQHRSRIRERAAGSRAREESRSIHHETGKKGGNAG
jgi:hypothetical protein